MATRKTKAKKLSKPPLVIRTFALTAENEESLTEIAAVASDRIGWKVSSSAVIRALLLFADLQDSRWLSQELFPRIEQEIEVGRVWGTKK